MTRTEAEAEAETKTEAETERRKEGFAPGRDRTSDPEIKSLLLYLAELLAHVFCYEGE